MMINFSENRESSKDIDQIFGRKAPDFQIPLAHAIGLRGFSV